MNTWDNAALLENVGMKLATDVGIVSYQRSTIRPDRWFVRDDMGTTTDLTNLLADWLIIWLNKHDADVLPLENDGTHLELTVQERYDNELAQIEGELARFARWMSWAKFTSAATPENLACAVDANSKLLEALRAVHVY